MVVDAPNRKSSSRHAFHSVKSGERARIPFALHDHVVDTSFQSKQSYFLQGKFMGKTKFGLSVWLACATVMLAAPNLLDAQAVASASITGQVADPTGAAVAGAKITMTETERSVSHSAISESDGRYVVPNLPVGPYRLEASAPGFKTYVQTGIVLQVGDTPEINISLSVGACPRA